MSTKEFCLVFKNDFVRLDILLQTLPAFPMGSAHCAWWRMVSFPPPPRGFLGLLEVVEPVGDRTWVEEDYWLLGNDHGIWVLPYLSSALLSPHSHLLKYISFVLHGHLTLVPSPRSKINGVQRPQSETSAIMNQIQPFYLFLVFMALRTNPGAANTQSKAYTS